MPDEYADIEEWHVLFDAICERQGHIDNAKLARDLCEYEKKKDAAAYDAAVKSLNNWRRGLHTPTRRNFRILSVILKIEDMGEVHGRWVRLYGEAQKKKTRNGNGADWPGDESDSVSQEGRSRLLPFISNGIAFGGVLLLLVVGAGVFLSYGGIGTPQSTVSNGPPVIDMKGKQIYWREVAKLAVGESMVVHGKRGRPCGAQPPSWEDVLKYLPELSVGVWSDGGVGFRISRACGGTTPARAVVVTATRPGVQRISLYDDPITIKVEQ